MSSRSQGSVREPALAQAGADHEEAGEGDEDVPVDCLDCPGGRDETRDECEETADQGHAPCRQGEPSDSADADQDGGTEEEGEREERIHNGQIFLAAIGIQ